MARHSRNSTSAVHEVIRAVGYRRVSTTEQADSGAGLAAQKTIIEAEAARRGWDLVEVHLPESEIQNLIVELRSATAGVGTFHAKFDHLAELTGKAADQVLAGRGAKAA